MAADATFSLLMRRFALLVLLLITLLLGAGIAAGIATGKPQAPFGEGRIITFVSGALLLAIGFLSYQMHRLRHVAPNRTFWKPETAIWRIMSFGFFYMAVDEVAQIHEFVDGAIHFCLGIQETGLTDRLDDVIVALYGVVGLLGLFAYRIELIPHRKALPFLGAGFILFFLMVGLDLLTNRQDLLRLWFNQREAKQLHVWLAVVEECFKLYAGAFIFLAFYRVVRTAWRTPLLQAREARPAFGNSANSNLETDPASESDRRRILARVSTKP